MKVCPECQTRFSGNESFCPNDATPLVDARELSPGELTGLDLNSQIHLERLAFRDDLAERYEGELRADKTPLRVTVFNEGFAPDSERVAAFEALRAKLGELVPPQVLSLHSVDLSGEHRFVAEEAPAGLSIAEALEQRKTLDWKLAVRVTCAVGRALDYLDEHGVTYKGLNAQTIFISDMKTGEIQLGDWAVSALAHPERPLEVDATAPSAFYGYSAFLAPETIRDAADTDQRSLVYSLGMLLYQLIAGKPPFTSKTVEDSLKRHLHEKPLKLSIACGGAGLHPDLDEILDMMWVKAPERRFQKIAASIAALSSLLDEAPDAVAPVLVAADKPVFDKTEVAAEPAKVEPKKESPAGGQNTIMGMPAISMEQIEAAAEEAKQEAEAEAAEAQVIEKDEEETPSIIIDESLLEPKEEAEETPSIIIDDSLLGDTESEPKEEKAADEKAADEKAADEKAADEKAADEKAADEKKSKKDKKKKNKKNKKNKQSGKDKPNADDEEVAEEAKEASEDDKEEEVAEQVKEDEEEAPAKSANKPFEIGFMETENDGGGEFAETWFGADADSAWDESQIEEHIEVSENRQKYITYGIIAAVAVAIFAAVFILANSGDEPADEQNATATESSDAEKDQARNEALRASFDKAVADGQLVRPVRGSALSNLEKLKRFAEDDDIYREARTIFIEKAMELARQNEADNPTYALNLAGYANQFDLKNEEIKAYQEKLRQQIKAQGASAPADDEGASEDGADAPDESAANDPKKPKNTGSTKSETATANPPAKPADKPAPKRSVSTILAEARAATKADKLSTAASLYREALAISPSTASIHASLGEVLFNQAKFSEALTPQKKAVQLSPNNNNYANDLGKTHFRLRQYSAAKKQWDNVLKRDPNNAAAKSYLKLLDGKL
ncbi:protein kinase domain-containing protein [Bradymonas sediminis]|uniref:protein kinase domain-containing protein n=1 Tax=Bradymonas sediminis TaxID=1548548 RepID=UPI00106109A2|nr:protein kinase [Bradymonas sediminis]TDP76653.1 serine/threonine protein kinase [Bradymonas sediminis]